MNFKTACTLCLLPLVAACASKSSSIQASYVSPVQYESYTCDQLLAEGQRLSARAAVVSGAQDKNRTSDAVLTGVAVVVFCPALFALEGDGQTAAELGRLKGELEAVEQASIRKNCGIQFQKT